MADGDIHYARAGRRVRYYIAFSVVMGFLIYTFLGPAIATGYALLAAIGFVLMARELRGQLRARAALFEGGVGILQGWIEEADRVRMQPWHADAVVDMHQVARRAGEEAHLFPDGLLIIPNPFLVLPLAGLVKWGFATVAEVHAAALLAASPNYPEGILPPTMMQRLRFIGWSEAETRARWFLSVSRMVEDSTRDAVRGKGPSR